MSKKFITSILMVAVLAVTMGMVTSCKDYDDDIKNLQEQIDKNTKSIEQINALITDGSVIVGVEKKGDGIVVKLSNGNEYEISNGTDAVVWNIGEDGYWYKNGTKTNYYALGKDGKDGKDGTNGTNGTNGKDGKDGKDGADGIYYYPNPETGNFDIYYADGTFKQSTTISWKATVSNMITAVMDQNELKLYGVQGAESVVTIALTNSLRSFVFQPEVYADGVPAIRVTSFEYKALTLNNKDSKNETAKEASKKSVVNPETYAYYHVNPANAKVEDLRKLKFVIQKNNDFVVTRAPKRAPASDDFDVQAEFVSFEKGILKVKVNMTGTPATQEKISVIALQTETANGEDITSDYATLLKKDMEDLRIADKVKFEGKPSVDYHFRRFISETDDEAGIKDQVCWSDPDVNGETIDLEMPYNAPFDVMPHLMAHELTTPHSAANLEALGMTFQVELVKNYKIGSNGTDQAEYVTLNNGVVAVKAEYGTSAIDRTPILRVLLKHGNDIVKVAYIKLKIVRPGVTPPEAKQYVLIANNFKFECGKPGSNRTTYQQMSKYIYKELNRSKTEFHNYYKHFEDVTGITYQGKADVGTVVELNADDNITQEGTHVLQWNITEQELWDHAGEEVSNVVRYYTSAGSNTWVEIVLTAKIEGIQKKYDVGAAYFINEYWNEGKTFTRFNVQVPQSTTDANPNNCVFVNDLNSPFVTEDGVLALDKAVTTFEYLFCDHMKGAKTIGGKSYNFTIENGGLTLKVNGEVIAQIKNNNPTMPFNTVTYNKSSDLAKELLNTKEMYMLFKVTGYACGDKNKAIEITFNGQDHFRANMVPPVKITEKAADNFIDGVDFEEKGSFIKIEDLIAPSDWRGRAFSGHSNYWDFYGPFSVEFDRKDAECDLNGTRQPVPATIELAQTNATSMGGVTSKYGFITYKNNLTVVNNDFNIFVKVTVTYGWGKIKTGWITVPVKHTTVAAPRH